MFVDRGYRGHDEVKFADYMSGQNRGIAPQLRRCLKRRQATEPVIGKATIGWDAILSRDVSATALFCC